MNTSKIDLFKAYHEDYATPDHPILVNINPTTYLSISGEGEPGGAAFLHKMSALQSAALTIKISRKLAGHTDYALCVLEAQLYGPNDTFICAWTKHQWCWKFLIRTPEFVTQTDLSSAVVTLLRKGRSPATQEVRLESLHEGLCVQMLHVGPFDRQGETAIVMEMFAQSQSLVFSGRHHAIYLSDPRRVPPEQLRTIVRVPVKKA